MSEYVAHLCAGCATAGRSPDLRPPAGWAVVSVDHGSISAPPEAHKVCSTCLRQVEAIVSPALRVFIEPEPNVYKLLWQQPWSNQVDAHVLKEWRATTGRSELFGSSLPEALFQSGAAEDELELWVGRAMLLERAMLERIPGGCTCGNSESLRPRPGCPHCKGGGGIVPTWRGATCCCTCPSCRVSALADAAGAHPPPKAD